MNISRWMDHIAVSPLRPLLQNPVKILRKFIDPGMVVLDVGCGTGFFSLGMAKIVGSGGRVICVDLSAEAIEDLKIRATKKDLFDRIETRVCNDRGLEIDDMINKIDFALAFYVMHHAEDVPGLMSQIYAALKSGRTPGCRAAAPCIGERM